MFDFVISAPGRISLFDEHIFTHDKQTFVSASLNLNTTLTFAEQSYSTGIIRVEYPQLGLFLNIDMYKLRNHFCAYRIYIKDDYLLHIKVQEFVIKEKYCRTRDQRIFLQEFLFLLIYIKQEISLRLRPFRVTLHTDLRFCADSGCAESTTVCLAACYFYWARLQKRLLPPNTGFDVDDLVNIATYSAVCEKHIHGDTSTANVILCTFGSILIHQEGIFTLLSDLPYMKILLIDTKKKRHLMYPKLKMMQMQYSHPRLFNEIWEDIVTTSTSAIDVLHRLSKIYGENNISEEKLAKMLKTEQQQLQYLIRKHQKTLKELGMSNRRLDTVCKLAEKYGFVGKYSDLSAGRYAYIWLLPDIPQIVVICLRNELAGYGYISKIISLSCQGVRVE